MIAKAVRVVLIAVSVLGAFRICFEVFAFGAAPFLLGVLTFFVLNAIYLVFVTRRPALVEVEAAARVLHEAGTRHQWWKPYVKSYDEMAVSDPIGKSEFDGVVERMFTAALSSRRKR